MKIHLIIPSLTQR